MTVVLASSSPRRRDLLAGAGVIFEVIVSPAEEIHDPGMEPSLLCEYNATLKALAVAAIRSDATVIGSDTLVFIDDSPLGKPVDLDEARAMLRRLSSRTHRVCTGVCVIHSNGEKNVFHDITEVTFRTLDDSSIDHYLSLVNPLDKAGAYGIQEHGDTIISKIRGSYENVMGLPLDKVLVALRGYKQAKATGSPVHVLSARINVSEIPITTHATFEESAVPKITRRGGD